MLCTVNGTSLIELVDFLGSKNKNLVCLGDTWLHQKINYNGNSERIKIFHPSIYTKVTSGEKAYMDMPVIAIYDFSGIEFLNSIGKLKDVFCENGYNAIAVSDSCKGIAYGIEYLPSIGNVRGEESENISLEHLSRIYDPDIIILGIDALNREPEYFERLENKYEIDIKICILNGQNQYPYDIIDIGTESKNILIIAGDVHESTGEKIINISNEFYIETLYQYIVELFDENSKLNCE